MIIYFHIRYIVSKKGTYVTCMKLLFRRGKFVTSNNLLKIMRNVVNVRNYTNQKIPEQLLNMLYEAFSLGPSSVSNQARELLVIENAETRQIIVEATLNPYFTKDSYGAQKWLLDAPFVAIVLIETRRAIARIGEQGKKIAFLEAESAIHNFRLMAQFHGIATTCIREFDQEKLIENLNLPWYIGISALLTAGYSSEETSPPPRLSVQEIVSKEEWN